MGYAFISYSHSDQQSVERMAKQLRAAGIEVWMDHHNLSYGERFWERIEKDIAGSAVFLPVMSKESGESDAVRRERGWASKYQRKIMPISLDGHIFPLYELVHCEKADADATVPARFVAELNEVCRPQIRFAAKGTLTGHRSAVRSVDFSPGGDFLVSAGDDRTVRIWDLRSGKERHVIGGGMAPTWPAVFTPDGTRVAAPSLAMPGVQLWSTTEAALVRTLGSHDQIRCIAFSPAGDLLATGGDDRAARVWDAGTGAHKQNLTAGSMMPAWPLCFSPDGKRLAVANFGSNTVSLWDTASLRRSGKTDKKTGAVTAVTFDPSGEIVISGGRDGRIELDTVDEASIRDLKPHNGAIHGVACSPDGKFFATAGADGYVKVIAVITGEDLLSLVGHTGDVYAVAISADSRWMASAGADASIRLWQRQ